MAEATKNEEVIELDEDSAKQLVDEVSKKVSVDTEAIATKAAEEAAKAAVETYVKSTEKTVKKSTVTGDEQDQAKGEQKIKTGLKSPLERMDSKVLFAKQALAFYNGETGELARLNKEAINRREKANEESMEKVGKAAYANETTSADGGYLVPDPEFDTTIYENLPRYGVVFKYGNTRVTDRNAIYDLSIASDLQFSEIGTAGATEATAITSGKLSIGRGLLRLRKFGLMVPATEELDEDSIVDYWNIVTQSLSRAYARKADELAFTDTSSGITNVSGVLTAAVSGAGTTITWDDLLKSEAKLEDDMDTSNCKWFMRKETYFRLAQTKTSGSGEYLWEGFIPNPKNPTTPWGTQIIFTRVLPQSTTVSANDGFAVYGDLNNYNLVNKRGMRMDMLTEAVVKDTGGSDFNLATLDAKAMRTIIRMLGRLPQGNVTKFVVLGTGTVS